MITGAASGIRTEKIVNAMQTCMLWQVFSENFGFPCQYKIPSARTGISFA
jgi:hypothetical protein